VAVFTDLCQRYLGVQALVVGSGVKSGIRILYDDPRQVGPDRVVDAVAAYRLYGGPVIVVDFGTATVFDAVSAGGDYLGGAIAPGLGISVEALFQRASLLSRIELQKPPRAIGRNTMHSMQSGIVFGYVGLIEGLVRRFREELAADARVIATGGLAPVIASHTPMVEVVNPDLTLMGLRYIYDLNRGRETGKKRPEDERPA
jgi:type III pantothenate kinase